MAKTAPKASASKAPSKAPARAGTVTDEMKTWAFLGVLLPIIGYVLILITKKGGAYAEHYGKQGLVLGIVWVIIMGLGAIFGIIGLGFISTILWVLWLILYIVGIVYAFSGERKEIPVVGEFASKF